MNTPIKDVEGYEDLQKRINEKSGFLEMVSSCFTELNKCLREYSKKIVSLNSYFTNMTITLEEQNIYEIYKLIYQKIIFDLENDSKLVDDILKNLNLHIKSFVDEKIFYEDFKKINKELLDEKNELQRNKKIYDDIGRDIESKIKQIVQDNYNQLQNLPLEVDQNLKSLALMREKPLDNYKSSIQKVNQLVEKFNNKQQVLLEYLPELGLQDGAIFFRTITIYLKNLETGENYLSLNRKQLNNSKNIEIDSALKTLLELSVNNKKNQKTVEFSEYKTELDFSKSKDENQLNLFAKTVETINKYINKDIIFKNYNYEQELRNFEVGQTIKKLYEIKGDIEEQMAEKFLNSLKDISVHKTAYIVLSQLRTNNRFQQSKSLITLLGKAFNILLDEAEKIKSYDNARNCIILSQTYYYNDDNKKKIYLFEFIKHHKWVTSANFWRNFIENSIKSEFERFETNYSDEIIDIEKNKNISKRVKEKLSEIIFSQLLPFTNNMVDFEMDKRIIVKIVDEFLEKYSYVSEKSIDAIFGLISKDKNEVEKFRKEYNPSLETQTKSDPDIDDKKEENKETKESTEVNNETKEEKNDKEESNESKKDESNA
jgi:hypothetical protein